jgi:DNA-binding response OmpR family regulator
MPSDKAIVHVIDDDEAIRQSLAFLLQAAKLEVKTYASAMAFLDSLPDNASSCVITDVRMPGMSGVDLLRRLKELKIAVPVIVITGHGDVALAVEAMKVGAVDFLEKPFDDDVLLASVQSALKCTRPPASISVAVVGEVATVIVVAMALVAIERFEIDLVQNDSQEIIVDAAGSIESVLRDVDLCFSPFDNKHEGIDEMSGRANVHHGSDRGEINDHVIVAFT